MNNIIQIASGEINKLEKTLERIDEFLCNAQEGCLKWQNRGEKTYYYQQYQEPEQNGKQKWARRYLKKEEIQIAKLLAKKHYYSLVKSVVEKQLEALRNFIKKYPNNEIEDIYDELTAERKSLITPLYISVKDQVKQWESEVYEQTTMYPESLKFETEQGDVVRSKSDGWNCIKGEVMDKKIKIGLEDEKVKVLNEVNDEERKSNSLVAIKDLLQNKEYIVVLDANILLKIYRSSPDYAEFVLECLDSIKDYVCIPFNVYWEYEKHRKEEYDKKVKSIENSAETCKQLITIIENKIKGQCDELSKNGYPDIDGLVDNLMEKVGELQDEFDTYFVEHQNLDFLNNWDEDKVLDLMNSFRKMPEPSALFIYKLCKEGEHRYKSQTPPGYKDAKKDGVSKYGDLIVWAETYEYAASNNKNIIFVTDDVKEDWWEKLDDGRILFRKELFKEFSRKTKIKKDISKNLKLIPLVGYDLYQAIAREFMIEAPDAISLILNATDESFVDEVQMQVFESVWSEIAYSGTSFLDENNSHVGSEGVDEWELDDVEFDGFERIDVDSGMATYIISYLIRISGVSYEYWGRDDDTKEIITSPGRRHECSGKVDVLVTRALDTVINWNDDFEYQDAEIETASITEDSYEDDDSDFDIYCAECGEKIGYEWDAFYRNYKGDPVCDDCMTTNENGFVCPGCGDKYPEEMRGASGTFCINCEDEYDV